jgi:hypothetical protein
MKNWKEGVVVSFHLTTDQLSPHHWTQHWKLYKRNWTQQRICLWAGIQQALAALERNYS